MQYASPPFLHKTLLSYFHYAKSLSLAQQLHSQIIINGLQEAVLYGSKITNAYIEVGSLALASRAFDMISKKNLHSWNTIISGYSKYRYYDDVLWLYNGMRSGGNKVDTYNLAFVIKACFRLRLLQNGRLVHSLAVKSGLEGDLYVAPGLIELYTEMGFLNDAQNLFEQISDRSSVSWGVMLKGYLKFSKEPKVFELFSKMRNLDFEWDAFTVECLVRACANVLAGREGKASHGLCIKRNLFDFNVCLRTTLVDMYMKCGFLHFAVRLFEEVDCKDVVLWSVVMDGYVKNGRVWEAILLFRKMFDYSITPNIVTLASILLACSSVGSLKQGKSVHGFVIRNRVDLDVVNYTSFIDMYAKCGCVGTAYKIFRMMPEKNLVSWSAMISCFGMHGLFSQALATFDEMRSEKHIPNAITFVSVLSACSHSGMVQEGWSLFESLSRDYAISPEEAHYACMIDLLGRVGQIEEALAFINNMPIKPNASAWGALLSACRIYKRVELAEEVASKLLPLEPDESSVYVLLSNIYADAGRWEMVNKTRMKMSGKGLTKSVGYSSIEVKSKLYVFGSEDRLAFRNTQVEHYLDSLSKEMRRLGYVPDIRFDLHDVDVEVK
ncbi:Pentatricopeptide repeat [Quillaja saponaria]|uniref:Pentatricopeptide repeat n=1 Tax=Quillaja saponaria TaxID=32244 RepID=A0AAD7VEB7_QUISA|nr:Pentatricopeptide repeat [Quillaja saponaria]KAJ7972682.1 Pentatricopeptide repeat [Quillaja saponaria]